MPGVRPLVLAIDVGTSSARCLLYRAGSVRPLRTARSTYPKSADAARPLPVSTYIEAVYLALDGIEAFLAGSDRHVDAAGISVFWHSVYVSRGDVPVSCLYLWNASEPRFATSAAALRARIEAERVRQEVGAPIHPSFPAGKALALLDAFPDRRGLGLRGLESALARELFGSGEVTVSMASATGLYDRTREEWHRAVLDAIGLPPGALANVVDAPHDVRSLRPDAARRWPHLASARWHLPRGDGALSHLGLGASRPERWALTVGTSAALRVMGAPPKELLPDVETYAPAAAGFPRALFCYRLDRLTPVTGGALSAGGNLLAWIRRSGLAASGPESLAEGEGASPGMPSAVVGPLVIPHLWGERSPDWPDYAWGGVVGLTAGTSAADLERAAVRAVAAGLGTIHRVLEEHLRETGRPSGMVIRAGGRAVTHSVGMRQMIADATGLPVECPPGADEASALGAAALAWAGLGYALPDLAARSQTLPRPGEAASYGALWQEIQRFGRTLGLSSDAEPLANSEHNMLTRKAPK